MPQLVTLMDKPILIFFLELSVPKAVSNWRNDGPFLIERADLPPKRIELVPKQEELF